MKHQIPYHIFSSFILRTPLFPIEFLDHLFKDINSHDQQIIEYCKKSIIQESIFLASPVLHNEMQKWINGKLTNKKQVDKLKYAITRYLLRMSTRCTPFGLFAGFSLGKWGDNTDIELSLQSSNKRHTRLDMNYLCALSQDLVKHPSIKEKLKFYSNTSIYKVGEQIRYVEYYYHKTKRIHHIVSVDNSEYLQKVLDKTLKGAYIKDLAELLISDEIAYDEACEFINDLVESQLLVSEIEPAITGSKFLDQILHVLNRIIPQSIPENIIQILKQTKTALEKIDLKKIGTTTKDYNKIAQNLKLLETNYELKYLFHGYFGDADPPFR